VRLVIALGGNALLRRGERFDVDTQRHNIEVACKALAPLTADHDLIITHGNGPQIGMLAEQSRANSQPNVPLDVLGAETEGMIGYLLEQELRNQLPNKSVASLLTQTLVDPTDPAFEQPDKFVGRFYSPAEAQILERSEGWKFKLDSGQPRRVVASPEPQAILELDSILTLSNAGFIVICAGGGGVPVVRNSTGRLRGIDAVVDKDHASELLAEQVGASGFFMLTDVKGVYQAWGTSDAKQLHQVGLNDIDESAYEAGSMRPKVAAARRFLRKTGCRAAIGCMEDVEEMYNGRRGTILNPLL